MSECILHTDGGSRGNPGPSGCGFVLERDDEQLLCAGCYLGVGTNNQAEYSALIWGLQNALKKGIKHIKVYADSELVVKQIKGEYKVKNANIKSLFYSVTALIAHFDSFEISHVFRNDNTNADLMANKAMDAKSYVGNFIVPFNVADGSFQNSLF